MHKNNIFRTIFGITFGIAIISFALFNNGFNFSVSAEAMGYNVWTLALIGLGVWVIVKVIKTSKK